MTIYDELTEKLVRRLPEVPQTVDVVTLDPVGEDLTQKVLATAGEATGLDFLRGKPERRKTTTVFRDDSGARATLYRASGAIAVRTAIGDFDELFEKDPGMDELENLTRKVFAGMGIERFTDAGDSIAFEHLWRICAAGADPRLEQVEPVLVRAIGAFRHSVRDVPVLGRASAHVEVTGAGSVSAFSVSMRRFAGQRSEVLSRVVSRRPDDAAGEIAKRLARLTDGAEDAALSVDAFSFGYLSLGRRSPQAVLAPMYVAAISVAPREEARDQTRSAHLIVVPGSEERFLKLPRGSAPARTQRLIPTRELASVG